MKNFFQKNNSIVLFTFSLAIILIFLDALPYFYEISTNHVDGQYQTFVGLDRLAKGQLVGRDFATYLGVGVLYLIYPFFILLGKTVSASQFSASFLCHGMCLFYCIWLSYLALDSYKNYLRAIFLGVLIFLFFRSNIAFNNAHFNNTYNPGGSLLTLRSSLPFLLSSIFFIMERYFNPKKLFFFTAFFLGLAPLWSNDYGIPTCIMGYIFFVLPNCYSKRSNILTLIVNILISILISISSYFLILSLISDFNITTYIKENFFGFAKDQYWYFGPYKTYAHYFSWTDYFEFIFQKEFIILNSMLILLFLKIKNPNVKYLFFIVMTCYCASLLSESFGHRDSLRYWNGAIRCIPFIFVLLITSFILPRFNLSPLKLPVSIIKISSWIIFIFIFYWFYYLGSPLLKKLAIQNKTLKHNNFYVAELGGYLPNNFKESVEFAREIKGKKILSEYYSYMNIISDSDHPPRIDSIIHALGDELRTQFENSITTSDYIITSNPDFTYWIDWNLYINWNFYKKLFSNFKPFKQFPNTILWKRKTENELSVILPLNIQLECNIQKYDLSSFLIEAKLSKDLKNYYGEITFCYETKFIAQSWIDKIVTKNQIIPVINHNEVRPFYGDFSLNPHNICSSIPLIAGGSFLKKKYYEVRAEPIDRTVLTPKSCKIQLLGEVNLQAILPTEYLIKRKWKENKINPMEAFVNDYNDANYIHGIDRRKLTKVRIPNMPELKTYLKENIGIPIYIYHQKRHLKNIIDLGNKSYFYIEIDQPLNLKIVTDYITSQKSNESF